MLDNEATLFRPGDDRVASLFLWHFVEEVEHRSSALIIYDAVVGNRYRMRALPRCFPASDEVMRIIADGVNAHVPEPEDRKVDARTCCRPTECARSCEAVAFAARRTGAIRARSPACR